MSGPEVITALRSLRVVRRYAERPIPDAVVDDLLEVARWTGTTKNTQPWHIVVVRERATLEALSGCGEFATHLAGAGLVFAFVMDATRNAFDCGRLCERVMLAAAAHGVGACMASLWPDENEQRAKELLGVPQERWMRQTVAFGYPADADARRVSTTPRMASTLRSLGRRPLVELVSWERFGTPR